MHLLSLEGISKAYPEKPVLSGVSLGISAGEHIGVIGRNGSGKSTLLAIIGGTVEPDDGSMVRARGLRIAHLEQDPAFRADATVGEIVGNDRAAVALAHRLGLTDAESPWSALSGGQRKRLALALALSADCDLLILDEPTNHLDVDLIDWLEDHLRARSAALLMVTHDRFLLDSVADRIVEIHEGALFSHQGSYEEYLEAAVNRDVHESAVEHRLRQRIKTELAWLQRSPKARTTKSRARVSQARDLIAGQRRQVRRDLSIELPARRLGARVVELHDAGKRYGDQWVLRHVELKLAPDARIGIVGPNAAGKTTLLNLIAGRIQPDEGRVAVGSTVHCGWYGQDPRPISPRTRVHAAVREHRDEVLLESGIRVSAAQLLERFQFSREQQQAEVGDLSGGERRRLELMLSLMEAPNLLLLDEPTNDLDIDTLNTLEEYLDGWNGAVVVASHDRYFLDRTCTDIVSIESDGSVVHHPGGWAAYRSAAAKTREAPRPATGSKRIRQAPRGLSYKERLELDRLEEIIPLLEAERDQLLGSVDEGAGDYQHFADLSIRLAAAVDALEQAESRWLELTEAAERLEQQ